MPDIPAMHRYFPSVPCSELSDLYSRGNQRLDGSRATIISCLPRPSQNWSATGFGVT